jgi:RNA polymerase sigma-70 factor (ECF subfamily)
VADIGIGGVGILILTNTGLRADPCASDFGCQPHFERVPEPAPLGPRLDHDGDEYASLMARIAGRDGRALADLHDSMSGLLHTTARRLLGSHECAQEVVGDVFVHVWQHAAEFDACRGTVKAWLCGITRHRAIDRWRRDRRHPLLHARLLLERVPDFSGPEQLLGRLEERTSVHAALSGLSPLRQKLLALSFFDGLSHEEISVSSGLPLGTVKSHLRRALRAMRTALPARVATG